MQKERRANRQMVREKYDEVFRNFSNAPKTNSSVILATPYREEKPSESV